MTQQSHLGDAELENARRDFLDIIAEVAPHWATAADMMPAATLEREPSLAGITAETLAVGAEHLRVYRPTGTPASTLMWIHGGAFAVGDLDMPEADWVARSLASHGHLVVSADYRKVPAAHHPEPLDDVTDAWRWTVEHAKGAGGIHLGGASAGGALAAGLTTRLRDRGDRMPDSLLLVYPILHRELPPATAEQLAAITDIPEREFFDERIIAGMNLAYAGTPAALDDPQAFAGHGTLTGFPPTMILVSERDMLRTSGELFAHQLHDAGIDSRLEIEPGSRHGQLNEPLNPTGRHSLDRVIRWLDERTTTTR